MRALDMDASPHLPAPEARFSAIHGLMPALLGLLLGNALQLQQTTLLSGSGYLLGLLLGLLLLGLSLRTRWPAWRWSLLGAAFVVLAFASTGWRAQVFGWILKAPAWRASNSACRRGWSWAGMPVFMPVAKVPANPRVNCSAAPYRCRRENDGK